MTKAEWKKFYRQLRIIRRENAKAYQDMILFGTGYIEIGPEVPDLCHHVPIENVRYC